MFFWSTYTINYVFSGFYVGWFRLFWRFRWRGVWLIDGFLIAMKIWSSGENQNGLQDDEFVAVVIWLIDYCSEDWWGGRQCEWFAGGWTSLCLLCLINIAPKVGVGNENDLLEDYLLSACCNWLINYCSEGLYGRRQWERSAGKLTWLWLIDL